MKSFMVCFVPLLLIEYVLCIGLAHCTESGWSEETCQAVGNFGRCIAGRHMSQRISDGYTL